jgi:hypothetical protein
MNVIDAAYYAMVGGNILKEPVEVSCVESWLNAIRDAWQPIETAPKDGTKILVYASKSPVQDEGIFVAEWGENRYWCNVEVWRIVGGYQDCGTVEPTHWMNLPKAPGKK